MSRPWILAALGFIGLVCAGACTQNFESFEFGQAGAAGKATAQGGTPTGGSGGSGGSGTRIGTGSKVATGGAGGTGRGQFAL